MDCDKRMDARPAEAEWERIRRIISRYRGEWNEPNINGIKNQRIPNTALLGNGDVGLASAGNAEVKQFYISKGDFWEYSGNPAAEACYGAPLLIGLCSIGEEGLDKALRNLACEQYVDKGECVDVFHETEDILNARVDTEMLLGGQKVHMKTYMAATENLMVTELGGVEAAVALQARLTPSRERESIRPITAAANEDGSITITRSSALTAENMPCSELILAIPYVSRAAVCIKLIGAAATASCSGDSASLTFTLEPGRTVYLVSAVCGGGQTYDVNGRLWEGRVEPVEEAAALLANYRTAEDLDALYEKHLSWWKAYWLQSYIDLDSSNRDLDVIQKYYYAAQYLLGSAQREGKIAAGLYGIWHANDRASWHSDYHMNYNFIAAFYGLATSNRASMLLPAARALLDYIPQGRANAASLEQLHALKADFTDELIRRGQIDPEKGIKDAIVFPVALGPYGMTIEKNAYWMESADAGYSIYPLIEYYNHTRDEAFLRDSLYPYIRLVNNFLEHWAIQNNDGTYTVYAGYCEGSEGRGSSWSKNAAFELSAYKNCLRYGIEFSKRFNDGLHERWEKIYRGLAPQPTNVVDGKTVLAFAEEQYRYGRWVDRIEMNGNPIMLDAILPGEVFGYYSSEEELEVLRNTVQWYDDRNGWAASNNFPRLFTYAINTRFPAAIVVDRMAKTIRAQMRANLMIDDGVHGIEKAGATEAVNNMLLLFDKGVIRLFGNWLEESDAEFARLRMPGAFVFSAKYDGSRREIVEGATMLSEVGETATIASLWKDGTTVLDSRGREVQTTEGVAPNHPEEKTYTFDTVAGETYTLEKKA